MNLSTNPHYSQRKKKVAKKKEIPTTIFYNFYEERRRGNPLVRSSAPWLPFNVSQNGARAVVGGL